MNSPQLNLCQFHETSSTYDNLCVMLQLYDPVEIILPVTMNQTKIVEALSFEFPKSKINFIARKFYNESKGYSKMEGLCNADYKNTLAEIEKKYLSISSCNALFEYIEYGHGISFFPETLKIHNQEMTGFMSINSYGISSLEILTNLKTGDSKNTLFSVLNYTKTPMGKRLLKNNLLQPLTDIDTINMRLDCISEMIKNEQLNQISNDLGIILDIDYILSQLIFKKSLSSKRLIVSFLSLSKTLNIFSSLKELIKNYKNPLLNAIYQNLNNINIKYIIKEIEMIIDENSFKNKNQQMSCIKNNIDSLLDITRNRYHSLIEELNNYISQLIQETGYGSLKLKNTTVRGYYLSMDEKPENDKFIQVSKKGKKYLFTTNQIISFNIRINELIKEIYSLTEKNLLELLSKIHSKIGCLYKISESISLLDLLYSFTNLVSKDYIKPEITKDGPIVIKQGRDPILENLISNEFYISNDTFISDSSNFQIITGPNLSGKTTYLKQVAHLIIMTQIGCYIPVKYGSIRIMNRIFTRIGNDDSFEGNMGSFMLEMKEISNILRNGHENSLIIIDELGRGTSNIEGSSIAWSICESLLSSSCFTLFVTHYIHLSELSKLYPNVKNYHLSVSSFNGKMNFLYSLNEGSCLEDNYGMKLAKMIGIKKEIIESSELISNEIQKENKIFLYPKNFVLLKNSYEIGLLLFNLKYSTLNIELIQIYLKNLKEKYKIY